MIKSKSELKPRGIEIDLTGPQGNAFFLLGYAKQLGKKIGMESEDIETMLDDMKSGDYEHLLEVFDENFGMIVTLYK